jgi:hypothetical protein
MLWPGSYEAPAFLRSLTKTLPSVNRSRRRVGKLRSDRFHTDRTWVLE